MWPVIRSLLIRFKFLVEFLCFKSYSGHVGARKRVFICPLFVGIVQVCYVKGGLQDAENRCTVGYARKT